MQRQSELRKDGCLPWLRPTPRARSPACTTAKPACPRPIDTVVLSTQHTPEIDHKTLTEAVIEDIIKPVLPAHMLTADTVSDQPDRPL